MKDTPTTETSKINLIHDAVRSTGFIRGLRAVADFFEQNPSIPVPKYGPYFSVSGCSKEQLQSVLEATHKAEKIYSEKSFSLRLEFAPWEAVREMDRYSYKDGGETVLTFHAERTEVCDRVVTGKKYVPQQIIPQQVIEAHEEDIVEWKCKPLLLDESESNDE